MASGHKYFSDLRIISEGMVYKVVSKSFRTGRLELELQMV
jgi:hypothetical protein